MTDRQLRFRLGLFVLITLALLGGLIVLFGRVPTWFVSRNTYTVLFPDAPGVNVGTPVRRSGVKIGEVSAVDLDSASGQVRVTLSLDPKYPPRSNEEPVITRTLLTGDTAIDFVQRDVNKPDRGEPLPPGTELVGVPPPSARNIFNQAAEVLPEAQQSLDQIRRSMQKLEQLAPQLQEMAKDFSALARVSTEFVPELRRTNDSIRELIGSGARSFGPELRKTNEEIRFFLMNASRWLEDTDLLLRANEPRLIKAIDAFTLTTQRLGETFTPENQRNFTETLKNVRAGTNNLERLSLSTEEGIKETRATLQRLNRSLEQADAILSDLRKTTGPLGERAPRVLQNLEMGTDQLNRAAAEMREILRALARADGTFQRFFGDPSLYNNLNQAACMVTRILPRVDRALRDFEVFADKIARHPEVIGVGGAVRPSAGLKEAPSAPLPRP